MSGLNIPLNQIMIDIACNNPDDGIFAGRAEMIEIAGDFLQLELAGCRAPKFTDLGDEIRLSRRKWPIVGSKDWIGNWCWNGYWMKIPIAVDFLAWLQTTRIFHCTCGEERAYNIWNSEKPFDKSDRDFFDRLLGKPSTWRAV